MNEVLNRGAVLVSPNGTRRSLYSVPAVRINMNEQITPMIQEPSGEQSGRARFSQNSTAQLSPVEPSGRSVSPSPRRRVNIQNFSTAVSNHQTTQFLPREPSCTGELTARRRTKALDELPFSARKQSPERQSWESTPRVPLSPEERKQRFNKGYYPAYKQKTPARELTEEEKQKIEAGERIEQVAELMANEVLLLNYDWIILEHIAKRIYRLDQLIIKSALRNRNQNILENRNKNILTNENIPKDRIMSYERLIDNTNIIWNVAYIKKLKARYLEELGMKSYIKDITASTLGEPIINEEGYTKIKKFFEESKKALAEKVQSKVISGINKALEEALNLDKAKDSETPQISYL